MRLLQQRWQHSGSPHPTPMRTRPPSLSWLGLGSTVRSISHTILLILVAHAMRILAEP